MRQSYLIVVGIFVGTAVLINALLDNPVFDNLSEKADFELQVRQPALAEKTLLQMVLKDRSNVDNHYRYIRAHFDIPEKRRVGKWKYEYRDDNTIQECYNSLAQSDDDNLADIGLYGKGLIQVFFENNAAALWEFQHVKNPDLPYLNNSLGKVFANIDSAGPAEYYFRKEIANKGNLDGAYSNLIQLLLEQDRIDELKDYLKDPAIKAYFPSRAERLLYFKSFQPARYGIHLVEEIFSGFSKWGAIAALLIMGSWMLYLRKLDIFEVEQWKHIIITVFLGMLFSFLTSPLTDVDNLIFGFKLNGGVVNDFFYCVIGIGAIEELVKIIPLLLMIRFTKAVNEPFDYIKYASLSALGFAFIENLLYFHDSNLYVIHGRALSAVVSHMFDSSIIAYGIILNKYKRRKNPYLNFMAFFALASLSHGFYDFWLINKSASTFSIVTTLYLLVSMIMWNSFKNNALNHSNFYDRTKSIDRDKIQDYLLYSLSGILLFEYIALAFRFSPGAANTGLVSSLYSGTFLIVFLSANLSRFSITKGAWAPVHSWRTATKITTEKFIDTVLTLNPSTKNDYAYAYLPNTGKILKQLTVFEEPDWYLVKLDTPAKQPDPYLPDTVLIRTKEVKEQLEKGGKQLIAFYILPSSINLERGDLKRTDFEFCGWATVE